MDLTTEVLIVDDEADLRASVSQYLELSGFQPRDFDGARDALAEVSPSFPGIVITDIRMPGGLDGMGLLKKIVAMDAGLPVILITGHGDVKIAVEAMRLGAFDFIEKPFEPETLAALARRAAQARAETLRVRALRKDMAQEPADMSMLLGHSPALQRLREEILDFAQADRHVLITGETGTGKTLIATALHASGPRQSKPFIRLTCAGRTAEELEAVLFGAEAGPPAVQAARDGSLCLESVEALPEALQSRLLDAMGDAESEAAGALRIIGTTTAPGGPQGIEGLSPAFYFRLAAARLDVPPLRERGEDVLTLFHHYAKRFSEDYGNPAPDLCAEDAALLMRAPWPGNVRQLIALTERAVLAVRRPDSTLSGLVAQETMDGVTSRSLRDHVEAFERALIENALRRHSGSVAGVMSELGLPRRTLNEKMVKYGLSRGDYT